MYLSNQSYDRGKWLVLIFLPALAVLIKGLGELYLWQPVDLVVTSLNLITAFLGTILQISSHHYHQDDFPPGLGMTD
ncbi:phage holin [Facklamia sp. DSM 111018]|uniref:Phage holin n=1 Tax=Facklamia lactis TaxID=2749967 RepID=A0ABS0LRR4_9LACT|nr:phage holin [Facklamia lactis]MBG9981042.1 phage holin [Facklamia lactis]MBG9986853.1 phage holin [Facklamia lactis]